MVWKKMQSAVEALRQEWSLLKEEDISAKSYVKVVEADLKYLEKRIQCAIPVDISKQVSKEIRFGATVKLLDENDQEYIFTIVGEDEAEPEQGCISWVSPMARELLGKKAEDVVLWERPAGDLELEILGFRYK